MKKLNARVVGVLVVAVAVAVPMAMNLAPASGANSSVLPFNYVVNATTHLKKLDQTITVPPGKFVGGINFGVGGTSVPLLGSITLPPATFTYKPAGLIGVATATAKIVQTKLVTGTLDLNSFTVTATATFNIRIVNAHLPGTTTNLVGNNCVTATPVSVTMSGQASLGGPSTFTGTFTIPKLKTCGLGTTALNLVLPGSGNTFTAVATPPAS